MQRNENNRKKQTEKKKKIDKIRIHTEMGRCEIRKTIQVLSVPHSKSGIVPRSSLLGAGQLGFWEVGRGGTVG